MLLRQYQRLRLKSRYDRVRYCSELAPHAQSACMGTGADMAFVCQDRVVRAVVMRHCAGGVNSAGGWL